MTNSNKILDRVLNGERLSADDGERLFESNDIISLGRAAQEISKRKHPDGIVTYIVDRNINYTNICLSKCLFCAFYREKDSPDAYILPKEELSRKIAETIKLGGVQILIQGGLNADLGIDFYEELVQFIKSNFRIHIHGFSPPEVIHISKKSKLSCEEVIRRLKNAGLGSIPGGGAEILVDKIREKISPNKCTAQEWLNVMESAHNLGLRTTATMMYGHIESYRDRIEHMTKKEFMNSVSKGREDILQQILDLLNMMKIDYCVIGGLAVNAYVEPVVSLDLDLIVFVDAIDPLLKAAQKIFNIERFPHSMNLVSTKSDLRIQLQTDPRYQTFISRSSIKEVMGYEMKVAVVEDVLQGKIWAYSDEQRRKSKRQKDLADIFRLVEAYPRLKDLLPEALKSEF